MGRWRLLFWVGGWVISLAGVVAQDWWKPGPGVNWDWRLSGTPKASAGVSMYNIDLFDVSTSDIADLRDSDIVVICYFSAGTFEEFRDDEAAFPRSSLGNPVEDFEEEWWININDDGVKAVMEARLDMAVEKGCDGVDPDGLEVYSIGSEVSGFEISAEDQLAYNIWIAQQAHERNLSVCLQNDGNQTTALEPYFDWALRTDCYEEGGCNDVYTPFIANGKAVLNAEFKVTDLNFCNTTGAESIDSIVKRDELDESRCSCGFPETNVNCNTLLSANVPTEAPLGGTGDDDSADSSEGEGDGGTPTWVIVTAIAIVVLIGMMAYSAALFRKRRARVRKLKANQGVDDFLE